ncbi:hypothetical protein LPMP_330890 [Leishmania panamensis]|uniref:Uncharacterized protein n=1 Tax=Leishmania panamensis TaxID=5679 RepID=A0A088SHR4_LEIPA|nr:hypothetical protein LPMP_330890 [Leishmania panamensis]AIO01382.1 hypothetical protein LPMP_330890 [Leishmania panamensis]
MQLEGAHPGCFLSVSQVLCAQTETARNSAVGLSVTLPPLCAWGACADTGGADESCDPRHGSYHGRTGAGSSSRYGDVWAPIESYLTHLSGDITDTNDRGKSGMAPPDLSPPLCLVLRLFPDLTIAQLPILHRGNGKGSRAPLRARGSFITPHEYPLEAILGTEELWGSGADPRRVFRSAIDCLQELGRRLLPQLPLVLQLPTRLLVSQQFLHDLATLLICDGWRSVSFELPSTHQLYSCHAEGSSSGVPAASAAEATDVGATDTAWCRLPLLCTPWATLCRHPGLGRTLRQLRRHDVVPFHVLYSWAVAEMQLFNRLELSIVVDTTAPMPGEEALHAYLQSPSSVGRSAEELHRAPQQLPREFRSSTGVTLSSSQTDNDTDSTHRHVYMSENPMTTRRSEVDLFNGVNDAVRRRGWSGARREVDRADLDNAEKEWRLQKRLCTTSPSEMTTAVAHTPLASLENSGGLSLTLDAPPDHLRALIEKSIVDSDASSRPPLSQRQRLLQKVGQFMQRTIVEPPATASDSSAVPLSNPTCEDHENASLKQEAEELERLLREANDASDAAAASSEAEMMIAEMQWYMRASSQASSCNMENGAVERASCEPLPGYRGQSRKTNNAQDANPETTSNAWSAFPGYWSCMHALVEEVTHATLLWTAPTFNKAAVHAWTAAYHASQLPSAGHGEAPLSRDAPLPLIIPIYMPVQSAMHAEVERLLREGRWFKQPPLLQSREEAIALHTWLPASLNVALADALSRMPSDYQSHERRRLLHDHQRLRREGARAARRVGSVIEPAAISPTSSAPSGDEDELYPVRIRIHQEARPLYLLTPAQVERRESQVFKEAAAACAPSGEGEAQLSTCVSEANSAFAQAVEEYYRVTSPTCNAVLAHRMPSMPFLQVPTPGLSIDKLYRSWRCLSSWQ